MTVNALIEKLPLSSSAFLAYALVGCIMLFVGSVEYGAFADNLLAIGIACGALGVPRALSKTANNVRSANFLGFIESLPIPSIVFILFLGASTVSLAIGTVEFGAFSDNVMKVGIACGAIQAPRTIEHVGVARP